MRFSAAFILALGAAVPALSQAQPVFDPKMQISESAHRVTGTTNLPDGMQLIVTLGRPGGPPGQDKVTIEGGKFSTAQFSDGSAPLAPGSYRISVTSGSMNFQPGPVQAILGKNGERLNPRSPLVIAGPLGREFQLETGLQIAQAPPAPAPVRQTQRVLDYEEKIKPLVVDEIYALAASQCGFRSDRWYTTIKEGISMRLTADTAGWTRAEVSAFEADHLQAFKNASQKPISCSGLRSAPGTLDRLDALERQITGNYH